MAHFIGTSGDDDLFGSAHNDRFDISEGGEDTVTGLGGDDTVVAGGAFDAGDAIDGGDGFDTLILDQKGNTAVFDATTLINVERLLLKTGNFDFTIDEATAANGASLIIDARRADSLILDTTADTDATVNVLGSRWHDEFHGGAGTGLVSGGAGDDDLWAYGGSGALSGGRGNDQIAFSGDYTVHGGGGNDHFGVTSTVSSLSIRGGRGFDSLEMGPVAVIDMPRFGAHECRGIEEIHASQLLGTADRNVINLSGFADETIVLIDGAGGDDKVIGGITNEWIAGKGGNDVLYGGGSYDSMDGGTGHNRVYGGDGGDALGIPIFADGLGGHSTLYGDAGDDGLFGYDGHYKLYGGTGDDWLGFRNCVVKDGAIDGGDGTDIFSLAEAGTILAFTLFDAATTHIEKLEGGAAAGSNGDNVLDFSGFALTTANGVAVDGRNGDDMLIGTAVADALTGSNGDDRLVGGEGSDVLDGGRGHDVFAYGAITDSNAAAYDTISGFDTRRDAIDVWFDVSAIGAIVTSGVLNAASVNPDLHAAIRKANLGANDAVVFTPDAGDMAGATLLIVDANGEAGYQWNVDLVILLSGATHLDGLSAANFI